MFLSKLKNAGLALLVVFFFVLGAGVISSRTSAGEQPAASVPDKDEAKAQTKLEYKALSDGEIVALRPAMRSLETGLNLLRDQGWELVAIEPGLHRPASPEGDKPALYVFKRQKK